jgi:serine phosphatase RsbU (regulator of sigma subunit)
VEPADTTREELAARVHSLSGEVAGLRRAMRTRGIIEQAKGMLAQRLGCTPEEAFAHLSRLSQEHNLRLSELAARLVDRTLSVLGPGHRPPPDPVRPAASDDGENTVELFAVGRRGGEPRIEPERLRTERQLATQRMRVASESRRLAPIVPASVAPELATSRPGLRIVARHRTPDSALYLRGAFYQAVPLRDGSTVLAVGDGYGSGAQVAAAMARLSAELRGLALAGVPPGRLLTVLNGDTSGQSSEPLLASLLVARYEPAARTVTWAQAGHPAPLVVRQGGATIPPRPPGVLLGLLPDTEYESARLVLNTGDAVVLYTDAVVDSRRTESGSVARELVALTGQAAPGGLAQLVAALNPADAREACVLAAQVVTAKTPPRGAPDG